MPNPKNISNSFTYYELSCDALAQGLSLKVVSVPRLFDRGTSFTNDDVEVRRGEERN